MSEPDENPPSLSPEPVFPRAPVAMKTIYETSSFNSSLSSVRSPSLDISHSSKMRLVPSIEDFVIVKNISSGAFGKVVLARHRIKSDQIYAVKVMEKFHMLNKNMAERVNNEKNALAISHSDFVVKIFYSLQSRSRIYLVMEYMIGGDLKNLLQRMIAFPESVACFYVAECALALEYLHRHGIIHRDIKPDNVVIGQDGHVKLTDFGLCNFDRENVEIGQSGILGTPDYLAPEILRRKNHTTAVDIWSLGVCLYEFLIGCPPFIDETVEQVFSNILSRAIDYPEGEEALSDAAVATIESLLETDVSLRPSAVSLRELPLFKDIDFSRIHQQRAPWIPSTSSDIDTACFEGSRARFDVALSSL
ncbi:serine/threonine-protein kinase greatwall [Galendromus occidentalis]|uniref:Serine/threonine-protein kinase greatwall n=1 Tax=Galendromus occidentalis TaxID=34638 RepID=A0AAJ6W0W8_9ACAR|nr:serine/threonine-protein kinase greatwall [Galendromus occidentalis]